ncbi:MAG: VOC family protein [Flavobacteriaceae bacterium]|nr:VOC family protein [Flavobacteriaceae bacterium]
MNKYVVKLLKLGIIAWVFLIFACSSNKLSMPISENDTEIRREGEIVWVDLVTNDGQASKEFFSKLLGWTYKDHGAYVMALSGAKPVSGIIEDKELMEGAKNSYWIVSASVKDVDAVSKKIEAKGGKILSASMKVSGRGKTAVVQDAQGAVFSILHSASGDPKASNAKNGQWMWAELWTKDVKAAVSFYGDVLNVTARPNDDDDNYFILKSKKYDFAGIAEIPVKGESPIWIPVLKVADPEVIAKKIVALGGSIMINPMVISGKKVALVATPHGAPFLIQQWN